MCDHVTKIMRIMKQVKIMECLKPEVTEGKMITKTNGLSGHTISG